MYLFEFGKSSNRKVLTLGPAGEHCAAGSLSTIVPELEKGK